MINIVRCEMTCVYVFWKNNGKLFLLLFELLRFRFLRTFNYGDILKILISNNYEKDWMLKLKSIYVWIQKVVINELQFTATRFFSNSFTDLIFVDSRRSCFPRKYVLYTYK